MFRSFIEKSQKKITSRIIYPSRYSCTINQGSLRFLFVRRMRAFMETNSDLFKSTFLSPHAHQTDIKSDDDFLSSWFILFQWLVIRTGYFFVMRINMVEAWRMWTFIFAPTTAGEERVFFAVQLCNICKHSR